MHYRDDLDLQNLIDFGQKEVTGGVWRVGVSLQWMRTCPHSWARLKSMGWHRLGTLDKRIWCSWRCPARAGGGWGALEEKWVGGTSSPECPVPLPRAGVPSPQFSCCGGVSYKDWSQNMYFNCTATNPSRERCSVPFSCCLHDAGQVSPGGGLGGPCPRPVLPSLGAGLSLEPFPRTGNALMAACGPHPTFRVWVPHPTSRVWVPHPTSGFGFSIRPLGLGCPSHPPSLGSPSHSPS